MAKTMVRTDDPKTLTEIWFRAVALDATPTPPETLYEWRSVSPPVRFEDDVMSDQTHDAVGGYGFDVRKLTDGTASTDDELGLGVADDGSLGGLFAKAIAEANNRETVIAGQRIPSFELRLLIEWLTNTTYTVKIRSFSYGLKRNSPEDGMEYKPVGVAPGEFKEGYALDATDLGLEATVGDVAWIIKTKILDVIKTAESIA